ncbi:uncharacterized protein JN550_013791 [Neoarthrinium moseri]|uniref:uncharacterized protein n=1 Tax=Neoarthrinium moseri TaxID=1658444 RepID=UPI001FDE8626|nr:uncharacterized protein JN550_013791 [Neoarthrinium moseri]KAI1856492.1 hypothetical protein JN550_013791 [Neoarthrinium moseri]
METYRGYVRTPADAIKLFEACRLGLLPRVQRRLSEKERQLIRSESVFVWDEREAGICRWTDGKSWSASKVSGRFLTYRELQGKRGSRSGNSRRSNSQNLDSGRLSDEDLYGKPEGYRYKAGGLMKQSFSITTSQGQHLHLISYYSWPHHGAPDLSQPSSDPQLRHIVPAKGMYPESSLHGSTSPALPWASASMHPYNAQPPGLPPPERSPYGYTWGPPNPACKGARPPSANNTPPWSAAKMSPDTKSQVLPCLQLQPHMRCPRRQGPPPQLPPPSTLAPIRHAVYGCPPYENERLPAPFITTSHPQIRTTSATSAPRLQQLQQTVAHTVMLEPCVATTSARRSCGSIPATPAIAPRLTPPRTLSVSPANITGPDNFNPSAKASLSALLHPTPPQPTWSSTQRIRPA